MSQPDPQSHDPARRIRQGGCTCGAVRFQVRGAPQKVGTCHCLTCRKATGAAFVFYGDWATADFSHSGETRTFQGRSFCPHCGSRLFHLSADKAEIMLGALDEAPGDLAPTREGWIIRREHWIVPVDGAGQFHGRSAARCVTGEPIMLAVARPNPHSIQATY